MELDRFIGALLRRWYVVVLCLALGIFGTWSYFQLFGTAQASATVAVLEPAVTKATSGGQQAQISFPSVAESYLVADRVVKRLGLTMSAKALQDAVTVKLSRSLIANLASPMYVVSVSDRDPDRAILLANTVVDEAQKAFYELNQLDPQQVTAAFQSQEQDLQQQLDQARQDLLAFEKKNRAQQLPDQIAAQRALVTNLSQTAMLSEVQGTVVSEGYDELLKNYEAAVAELNRMRDLLPEYQRLAFAVSLQSGLYTQLESRALDPTLVTSQAKIDDQAAKLEEARNALSTFEKENNVQDLPSQLGAQLSLTNELRGKLLTSTVSAATLDNLRSTETAELDRLVALLPQYEDLSQQVATLGARIEQIEQAKLAAILGNSITIAGQIKPLDSAMIEPDRLWTLVLYVLGIALGIFIGVTAVYLWAYYDRTPRLEEEVGALVGIPVLARVPRA